MVTLSSSPPSPRPVQRRFRTVIRPAKVIALGFVLVTLVLAPAVQAGQWPRFRGPNGSGVVQEPGVPERWTPEDFTWVTELPGEGHGSPANWGDSLFIQTATEGGSVRHLLCLDARTGDIRWTRSCGFNQNRKHLKNSFASQTPAVDGERVYVAVADQERLALAAYDFQGELLWRTWLGSYLSQHGHATSPIVFEDLVILANDQDGPSAIVAVDRRTGDKVWSTLRTSREASYATPILFEPPGGKPQLICINGATGITSLDPWSGAVNWGTEPVPQRTVASPVICQGALFASCGQGGKGTLYIGITPPKHAGESPIEMFRRDRVIPYVPTAISYQDRLYLWNDNGVVSCVDPRKDETIWTERVGGNYSASPICVNGKLYGVDEAGEVAVLDASPTYRLVSKNTLGDPSHATPAAANGRLYFRTFHRLICLGKGPPPAAPKR